MSSFKEKFQFMDDGIDVPFYNGIPELSNFDWIVVFIAVLFVAGAISFLPIPDNVLPFVLFAVPTLAALYISRKNYGIFLKRLKRKDFTTIILCLIAIYLYTFIMTMVLQFAANYTTTPHVSFNETVTLWSLVVTVVQVFGEEFFKILLLILLMYVIYRFTQNRTVALYVGLVISMVIFGMLHYAAYDHRILQIIFITGFGSFFEYYAYLKTKNVFVSFIIHALRDSIPLLGAMFLL